MTRRLSVLEAKELHEKEIMAVPGVTGIGVGRKGGRACIMVYVRKAEPEILKTLPKEMEGFPVRVEESEFFAL